MSSLTDDQIEALLSALAVLKFKESETIITQGETSPEFYLIKEGLVNIYNKNKNIIYTIKIYASRVLKSLNYAGLYEKRRLFWRTMLNL